MLDVIFWPWGWWVTVRDGRRAARAMQQLSYSVRHDLIVPEFHAWTHVVNWALGTSRAFEIWGPDPHALDAVACSAVITWVAND